MPFKYNILHNKKSLFTFNFQINTMPQKKHIKTHGKYLINISVRSCMVSALIGISQLKEKNVFYIYIVSIYTLNNRSARRQCRKPLKKQSAPIRPSRVLFADTKNFNRINIRRKRAKFLTACLCSDKISKRL